MMKVKPGLTRCSRSVLDLLFPRLCGGCGERLALDERLVCARCQLALPLESQRDWDFNRRRALWDDHRQLVRMGALARYARDNVASELVRSLKFRRHYALGDWMGRTAVALLGDTNLFEGVDVLIPIPLTPARQHLRGFNQAEAIARGMAAELHIPVRTDVLVRLRDRESQTHFSLRRRLENADHVFALRTGEGLQGLHIMLVDDVMTTGTTMLGALEVLEQLPDVRISTFAWAWAHLPAPAHT